MLIAQVKGGDNMRRQRHNLVFYALEDSPRPGMHEIRVRPVPDGMRIRNKEEQRHG